MKKRIITILMAIIFCAIAIAPTAVYAVEEPSLGDEYVQGDIRPEDCMTYESFEGEIVADDVVSKFVDPELASDSQASGYVYSYYRVASSRIVKYDSKSIINSKFLLSVARGQTEEITTRVTTTGAIAFSASVEAKMKEAIGAKVGANSKYSITVSVEKKTSFTFPQNATGNYVSFYVGVGFDEHEFRLQRYDVYQKSQGSAGLGTGFEHRKAGIFVRDAHIPKKVVYSVVGKVN